MDAAAKGREQKPRVRAGSDSTGQRAVAASNTILFILQILSMLPRPKEAVSAAPQGRYPRRMAYDRPSADDPLTSADDPLTPADIPLTPADDAI